MYQKVHTSPTLHSQKVLTKCPNTYMIEKKILFKGNTKFERLERPIAWLMGL